MKHIFIILIAGLIYFQGFAQNPTSFPEVDTSFLTAFNTYLQKSKRTESTTAAIAFVDAFNSLSSNLKTDVKQTANGMLKNKVRNFPVFTDYANIITAIVTRKGEGIPQEHITILKELMDASKPSATHLFESYIEYLPKLFDERVLYQTKTKGWYFNENATYNLSVKEGQPLLTFKSLDLHGVSKNDSVFISKTSGICYPIQNKFLGNSGKMNFSRAGISENEAFVELTDFTLDLDQPDFAFDSVYLTFPKHLDGRIQGRFEEKLYSSEIPNVSYPRFTSKDIDLNIKNISERVSISGGIILQGNKIIIFGSKDDYANIVLSTNGKKQLEAESLQFVVNNTEKQIIAENAAVVIYLSKDSIFHPSLLFNYFMDKHTARLDKGEGIAANVPYESPYHQMTIGLNSLLFDLDSSNISFVTIDKYTGNPVPFTSYDHYILEGELRYLTLTGRNPLQMIKTLAESYGTDDLSGQDLAGMLGYPLKDVESIIYKLAKDGFVFYDPITKKMHVNYKTYLYMMAGKGEIDYDHMIFLSEPKGNGLNGILSLDSQTIVLNGIENFDLSKPKQVKVYPKDNQMILTEDRDLDLEGTLEAGKLKFKGQGIHFDYKGFKADMRSVDSLIIYVKGPENQNGEYEDIPLKSIISNIKGILYIDDPSNRSGVKEHKEFPYFESFDTSYVFFDQFDTTAYSRDKFYFAVLPFKLDSIVTALTDSITFMGQLVTNDIFSPFNTSISVQQDYSLGIDEIAPSNGLEIYKGAGRYFGNYKLTKKGLTGNGKIKYRQSEFGGKEIKFLDDSVYVEIDTFKMIESVTEDIPQAFASDVIGYWKPYDDNLFIDAKGKTYSFYNDQLQFNGGLLYKEGILKGVSDTGTVSNYTFYGSELSTEQGIFKKNFVETLDGTIGIGVENGDDLVSGYFEASILDFSRGIATFENFNDSIMLEIPSNELVSNMQQYQLDFKNGKVNFTNNEENSQYFLSTLEALDSLKIYAKTAVYDVNTKTFEANEIDEISLADSKFIPAGKKLVILEGGNFDVMENATLVLNSAENFHTINNANLVINSRNDFKGTGNYKYVSNNSEYDIPIDEIKVKIDTIENGKKEAAELKYSVTARGVLVEDDHFKLSDQLLYKGNIFMASTSKDIQFEGFGKLDFKQKETSSWFNLDQGIDPNNFAVELDSLKDEFKQNVIAGLFVSPGELEIYSAIMEPIRSLQDPVLHLVDGALFNGINKGEYIFGTKDSLSALDLNKSIMKYNDNTGEVQIDGFINWTSGIPKVNVNGFGTLNFDPVTRLANGKSTIAIDFPLNDVIWYEWPRDIVELNYQAKAIDYNRPEFKRALRNYITNNAEAELIIQDIEAEGLFKLPVSFLPRILLTDVELKWDEVDGNFKSVNTIGLSSIAGYPIDQQIKAYVEFGFSFGSGYMNIYLETKSGDWYYISAKKGNLYAISSDSDFNDMVEGSKVKTFSDEKKGPIVYEYSLGNLTSKLTFMARIEDFLIRTEGVGFAPIETKDIPSNSFEVDSLNNNQENLIEESQKTKGKNKKEATLEQIINEGRPESKESEGMPWNAPKNTEMLETEEELINIIEEQKLDSVNEVKEIQEKTIKEQQDELDIDTLLKQKEDIIEEKSIEKKQEVIKDKPQKEKKSIDKVEEIIDEITIDTLLDKNEDILEEKAIEIKQEVIETKPSKGKKTVDNVEEQQEEIVGDTLLKHKEDIIEEKAVDKKQEVIEDKLQKEKKPAEKAEEKKEEITIDTLLHKKEVIEVKPPKEKKSTEKVVEKKEGVVGDTLLIPKEEIIEEKKEELKEIKVEEKDDVKSKKPKKKEGEIVE